MPTASNLDEHVEVLTKSTTENDIGETETTYSVDRTLLAGVEVGGGSERRVGGRPEEEAAIIVTMREADARGIGRSTRLRYREDDLQVQARRVFGPRKRWVELDTTRVRT